MSKHLVLLGDSILDNAAYVPGGRPAVIDQVRSRLPEGWAATLLAVDGSVINDVYRQLEAAAARCNPSGRERRWERCTFPSRSVAGQGEDGWRGIAGP